VLLKTRVPKLVVLFVLLSAFVVILIIFVGFILAINSGTFPFALVEWRRLLSTMFARCWIGFARTE